MLHLTHKTLLAGGTAAVLILAACGGNGQTTTEPTIRPVRTIPVQGPGADPIRNFAGVSQAGDEMKLSFKVPGTIRSLPVKVGQMIRAGQLIAALDDADYRLRLQQADAALAQARSQSRTAAAGFERIRQLFENNHVSRNDYDLARAAMESAAAAVEATEKQRDLAQRALGYCVLRAPVSGTVSVLVAEANENIAAGYPVAVVLGDSRTEVTVGVPENFIASVNPGDRVSVTFSALPDRVFPATVTEVAVSTNARMTTFPVTAILDESDHSIRSGMAASVAFTRSGSAESTRIVVPAIAVGEDRGGRFVYLAEAGPDGDVKVTRRAVKVGAITPAGIEILDGLRGGELLITAGVSRIHDGQRVRLLPGAGN